MSNQQNFNKKDLPLSILLMVVISFICVASLFLISQIIGNFEGDKYNKGINQYQVYVNK